MSTMPRRWTSIFVRTQFEAFHRWKDAPEEVKFLRSYHRHIFHVKATIPVAHDNRDVEFFMFKRQLDEFLREKFAGREFDASCEMLAGWILDKFSSILQAEVSEDGENGATVTRINYE